MRWLWIDKFVEFKSGCSAKAIKNVSLAEGHLDDYYPGFPVMTPSLVVEGFAQCGGLLIGQMSDFTARIVLAKVSRLENHFFPRPGDTLAYEVSLESIQPGGALVKCTSHVGEQLQCEAQLFFAELDRDTFSGNLFEPFELMRLLRNFRLFEVGVDSEGNPLQIPQRLLDAEALESGSATD